MTVVPSGRHPLALFLLAACVASGAAGLLNPAAGASSAVARVLPEPARIAWYAVLLASSLVAMVGVAWPHGGNVLLERAALTSLGSVALLYAATIAAVGGWLLSPPAAVTVAFALGCLGRAWQITRALRRPTPGTSE